MLENLEPECESWRAGEEHCKVKLLHRRNDELAVLYEGTLIEVHSTGDANRYRRILDGILYGLRMLSLICPSYYVRTITFEWYCEEEDKPAIFVYWRECGFTKECMDALDSAFMETFNCYAYSHISDRGEEVGVDGELCQRG
jgi:hypothetical protein